jgi:hypothetical protein
MGSILRGASIEMLVNVPIVAYSADGKAFSAVSQLLVRGQCLSEDKGAMALSNMVGYGPHRMVGNPMATRNRAVKKFRSDRDAVPTRSRD